MPGPDAQAGKTKHDIAFSFSSVLGCTKKNGPALLIMSN